MCGGWGDACRGWGEVCGGIQPLFSSVGATLSVSLVQWEWLLLGVTGRRWVEGGRRRW